MGDLFGGSTKTTSSETTETGPSKFQLPYLQSAFDAAKGAFGSSSGTPFYQGDLYAGMSDEAKSSLEALKGYASGTGLATAGALSSIGQNLSGYAGKAGTTLDQYLAEASADPTQATIDAASKYAANPQIDAMIDANSRDVVRNLNEQTLPTLNRVASGTGNINSSRAGVAEGVARRGAEDRVADISATLRGQAYDRGLSLAQADRSTRLGALGTAASAYSGLAGQGISALQAGANTGYGAYGQIAAANQAAQADKQGQLDADYAKWQGQDERQWDLLNRYFSIIGGNQWGQSGTSTGTATQKTSGNIFGQLAGTAASVAAFA